MSLILDLIILLLFVLNVYTGYKHGLIRTVLNTCSTLVSLVVAYFVSPMLGEYIATSFLKGPIENTITEDISALMHAGSEKIDLPTLFKDAPQAFINLLEGFGVDLQELQVKFESAIEAGSEDLLPEVVAYIAGPIASMAATAIAFLAIFVACVILLRIACAVLDTVCMLPVLKQINQFLGLALGALTGFLIVWGISAAMAQLLPALSHLYPEVISESTVENTVLVKILATLNLIPNA